MVESLIAWLIVGAIAGWLAGLIVKGFGFGLVGNIVVGIIGAVIAGWLLPRLGIGLGTGMVAAIINAVIGAVVLLVIIGLGPQGHLTRRRDHLRPGFLQCTMGASRVSRRGLAP